MILTEIFKFVKGEKCHIGILIWEIMIIKSLYVFIKYMVI